MFGFSKTETSSYLNFFQNKLKLSTMKSSDLNFARYSPEELQEFKDVINGKLKIAQDSYAMSMSSITQKDGNGTQDTSPTFKVLEEGEATLSKEEAAKLAAHHHKHIGYLNAALIRIENHTFGYCYCENCKGARISKQRLMVVPHATKCVEEKKLQERPMRSLLS